MTPNEDIKINRMTYEQIKKALECCVSNRDCSKCVFLGTEIKENTTCEVKMIKNALNLINRQQTEIKRLKQKFNFADDCIWDIEDALNRGSDNDWAREHIAKYEEMVSED